MATTPEQIAITHQTALDTALIAVKTTFNYHAGLIALSINTAHSLLDDTTALTRKMLDTKSFDEMSVLQLDQMQRLLKTALSYYRSAYNIITHGTGETIRPLEIQLSTANKIVARKIEKAVESAPAGSEAVAATVKSGIDAASNAYDRAARAGRRVVELAETHMTTASDAAVKVVNDTTAVAKEHKTA